jgi:hypoxanthine phosphoribosyltransferase
MIGESVEVLKLNYILNIVKSISRRIEIFYDKKQITMIPILDASFMFSSDLSRNISLPMKIKFMKISSYIDGIATDPKLIIDPIIDEDDKELLVVDTIVDSGSTLELAVNHLSKYNKPIKTCALIRKNNKSNKHINIDFEGMCGEEGFLFGYGTDFKDGTCRNLDCILSM